jgi:tetratricopeptide (TPR) repeat protein
MLTSTRWGGGKTAEAIYRITQPFRYAIYLMRHENRAADAVPIFKDLALHGSPEEQIWSYPMWASATASSERNTELALGLYKQAHDAHPTDVRVHPILALNLFAVGRIEEALQVYKEDIALIVSGKTAIPMPANSTQEGQAIIDQFSGAYHDSLPLHARDVQTGRLGWGPTLLLHILIRDQVGEHDLSAARASVADYPKGDEADLYALLINLNAEEWAPALKLSDAMAAYLKARPHDRLYALVNYATPLALAQAHLGDFAAAERTIAPTPGDCYPCLITRAQIAELQGQHARADWWFKRANYAGPSLPFAFYEEGKVLLARGKPDDAVARFTIANQKCPHFADPLEGWGETLMLQKHPDLALAKFEEADKYAPNWGRLHLKWGEALGYAGEARKQFARAAQLDLTAADKAELARVASQHN